MASKPKFDFKMNNADITPATQAESDRVALARLIVILSGMANGDPAPDYMPHLDLADWKAAAMTMSEHAIGLKHVLHSQQERMDELEADNKKLRARLHKTLDL